jgi:hypothetical protein
MAVWQYKGEFVPELWLIAEHGRIPEALEDYLMTEDTDLDAIEAPHWWRDAEIPSDLIQRVSAIMPQTKSWTDDALMFGDDKTSDFEIWFEQGEVDAIHFRWDLRDPDLEVLNQIVVLAKRLGAYIVSGDRGTVIEPSFQAVLTDVRASNAYRFCKNPEAFLTELGRKKGKG